VARWVARWLRTACASPGNPGGDLLRCMRLLLALLDIVPGPSESVERRESGHEPSAVVPIRGFKFRFSIPTCST
jgi:hypothetical protein